MPPLDGTYRSGPLLLRDAALFTDLYELTMAAGYFHQRMAERATFSLFVRRLPPGRSFLVAAGLEDALDYLADLHFSAASLEYLGSLGTFAPDFLDMLGGLRFTGEVWAVPEGTVVFADEPLLEVTAPILEAQLVETALLNLVHLQTTLASKAVRSVIAAQGRPISEFGLRRSHGTDAGLKAARASYIAGCDFSSNVLAGLTYDIPLSGTMAHSYVTSFERERDAFHAFARLFPDSTILLIDSYDTVAAAHIAVEVARSLAAGGHKLRGVRLDSGDLAALSREVRSVLDAGGFPDVKIFVSGGLDEYDIEELLGAGAPIDAFGVGTRMNVSADAPSLDMVYKLVSYGGRDIMKASAAKETWVGEKALYRMRDEAGRYESDLLALRSEPPPVGADSLLEPVMRYGRLLRPHPPLADVRHRCAAEVAAFHDEVRSLRNPASYPVRPSEALLGRQAKALEAVGGSRTASGSA